MNLAANCCGKNFFLVFEEGPTSEIPHFDLVRLEDHDACTSPQLSCAGHVLCSLWHTLHAEITH